MPQTATIKSLPVAFAMLKAMEAEGVEWGEDYRGPARQALADLLQGRMAETIDRHLERLAEVGQADRRNGAYLRWLLTELGRIELHVPRPSGMASSSGARPAPARSPGRSWWRSGGALMARRRSATSVWPPPKAPPNGSILGELVRRGLLGERLEMLCVDGGSGLLAALPTAFPEIPVQRCRAHKIRNVLSRVRKPDQATVKAGRHRIINATALPQARSAARRFADRWDRLSQGSGVPAR